MARKRKTAKRVRKRKAKEKESSVDVAGLEARAGDVHPITLHPDYILIQTGRYEGGLSYGGMRDESDE